MTKAQKALTFLLGLLLIGATVSRQHFANRDPAHDTPGQVLSYDWSNGELILRDSTSHVTGQGGDLEALPGDARLLFFGKIPINTASIELLMTLPGIGPKTARQIVALRTQRQRFESVNELQLINGIGRKKATILDEYLSFE